MSAEVLFWQVVLYQKPRDHPAHFVLRRWAIVRGQQEPRPDGTTYLFDTVESAREYVETAWPWLVRLDRMPADDPCIVEVYT